MEVQSILKKISQLPKEAQTEAIDFINFLELKYKSQNKEKSTIDWDAMIGLWEDCVDMQDSVAWVRDIRQSRWRSK